MSREPDRASFEIALPVLHPEPKQPDLGAIVFDGSRPIGVAPEVITAIGATFVVVRGEGKTPVLLSGGDVYGVARGGLAVIADRARGEGDSLPKGGKKGVGALVLLIDLLGGGGRVSRIERVEIGGGPTRLSYGELNERREGVLGDALALSAKKGRGGLVEVLSSNLQVAQEPAFGGLQ